MVGIVVAAAPAMGQISYIPGDDIALDGAPAGLAVHQGTGDLFVGRPLDAPGAVDRFDQDGTSLGPFATGLAASGVATDASNVYVLDAGTFDSTPDINTFNATTGAPVGSPLAVDLPTFDPAQAPQIAAFIAATFPSLAFPNADDDVVNAWLFGTPLNVITNSVTLVDPRAVAGDDQDEVLFIVDAADGGRVVKVVDPITTGTASVLPNTTGATSVALNPATGDLYVGIGDGSAFHVVVFDPAGTEIGNFGLGDFADGNTLPRNIAVEASTKKVYISDDAGGNRVAVYVEGEPPPPPTAPPVTTMSASGVAQTTATLAGAVGGTADTPVESCRFDYTDDADFLANGFANAATVPCPDVEGATTLAIAVEDVAGLAPNTTYRFRIVASNSIGTTEGSAVAFKTLPNPPTVVTGAATDVQETRATLGGTVNPHGGPVSTCEIDFGTTTAYGHTRPCAPGPGKGTDAVAVSADAAGLAPGTTYHFRVRAANAGGAADGQDQTFTTVARPHPCAVDPERCKATDQCVVTPAVCRVATKATLPGRAPVRAGRALIKLSCKGAAGTTCKGTLRLRARIKRAGRKARTRTVGRIRYQVAAGSSKVLRVRLSRPARSRLGSKGRLRVRATGTGITGRSVLLRLRPSK